MLGCFAIFALGVLVFVYLDDTYGEMVAMAGDYFGSIAQMRTLAANPGTGAGTREELEYVQ